MYLTIKHIHIIAVVLTAVLFVLRGIWMLLDSSLLQQRWVKIVPHIVDTVLLASAIILMLIIHQYPFVNSWLTAKVLGLLVYIGLGMVALRYGRTKRVRVLTWVLAMGVFVYVVGVALFKDVFSWSRF